MENRKLLIVVVLLVVLCNSIVYSALNSEMLINGDAYVRVKSDIRITDLKLVDQTGGAYETYNSDYSKNTTSMQITLPSSESVMIYEVTVTNNGSNDYIFTELLEEVCSNDNIKYELINLKEGDILNSNYSKTFQIKLTSTVSNTMNFGIIVLKYNFIESMEWTFSYTGDVQSFVVPTSGNYKLELWGGGPSLGGGAGGYSSGNVNLSSEQLLYIVVGEGPINSTGGYNGGGNGNGNLGNFYVTGGGGATHISTTNRGILKNYENFKDEILIVAAGGGGGTRGSGNGLAYGGAGGGLVGLNGGGHHYGSGATQTAGGVKAYGSATDNAGSFGKGSDADPLYSVNYTRYYGGGGGGGSSFVDNVINGVTIAGDSTMPSHDGLSTMVGNSGHGYVKISFVYKN